MRPWPALATLLLLAALSGCGDDASSDGRLVVVTTTTQVGDLVRNVAGGRAEVEVDSLLHASADPHDFEPRPSDVTTLARADLIVRSGGDLDEWLDDVIESSGSDAARITLLDSVVPLTKDDDTDPHWWHDPRNGVRAVGAIRAALADVDPAGASAYERAAAEYSARLRALDRSIAACVANIPPGQRKLVTSHDALGYFARRYGLDVLGSIIPALSSQAQPSAGETSDLVKAIRRTGIRAIFPESSLNPKLERAVARDAGVEVGDELYADTLGPDDSVGATYVGSLTANARAIVSGLAGSLAGCGLVADSARSVPVGAALTKQGAAGGRSAGFTRMSPAGGDPAQRQGRHPRVQGRGINHLSG